MSTESDVQQFIQMEAVKYGCVLLRNNSGSFQDATGRPVRFGLGNISRAHNDRIKSSDLIGVTTVIVTQEMVGRKLAVFTAVEVKRSGWKLNFKDPREKAQLAFIDWIYKLGGFGGFASSVEDFKKILGVG